MAKLKITISPKAVPISATQQAAFNTFMEKLDPLIEKAGFDTYLITVGRAAGPYSTAIGADNVKEAERLLSKATKTVGEYKAYQARQDKLK